LPATIRSRCQRLEFRIPSRADAQSWLRSRDFSDGDVELALTAARGNPGLAAEWLGNGGLQLRIEVTKKLNAIAAGQSAPVEVAQQWLSDENGELRLRFAAELALEAMAGALGSAGAGAAGLKAPTDLSRFSNWYDALNRTREQLRAPLRNDLVLAGLLHEWRTMFPQGR
jgi:DNA polymerase-3 subunit delta'